MRELSRVSSFLSHAVKGGLHTLHDLFPYKHVLLSLNLLLQIAEVLVRENLRKLVHYIVLGLQLASRLLELHFAAVKLTSKSDLLL